jgi:hypothetical protein
VQESQPRAVAEQREKFGGQRELLLAGGTRVRIMRS